MANADKFLMNPVHNILGAIRQTSGSESGSGGLIDNSCLAEPYWNKIIWYVIDIFRDNNKASVRWQQWTWRHNNAIRRLINIIGYENLLDGYWVLECVNVVHFPKCAIRIQLMIQLLNTRIQSHSLTLSPYSIGFHYHVSYKIQHLMVCLKSVHLSDKISFSFCIILRYSALLM